MTNIRGDGSVSNRSLLTNLIPSLLFISIPLPNGFGYVQNFEQLNIICMYSLLEMHTTLDLFTGISLKIATGNCGKFV